MPSIDLDTLLKHYSEGRISKKEFVYLHSLITQSQKPMRKRSAPVLRPQNYRPQAHPQSHPQSMAAGEITFPKTGIVHFFKSRYKSVMAFAGSLWIFATLAVNYYNGLSLPFRATESGPNSAIVQQAPLTKTQSRPVTQKDIQPLAQALMEKPIWEAHDINEFTTQWIMLSAHKKDTLKNTKWFDPFVESFKKQIKFELARQHDGDGSIEIENRHRALLQLAVSLGMVRQPPRNLAALDELIAPQAPVRGKNSRNGSAKQAPKTAKAPTSAANVKSKATTASKKPSVKSANSKTKAAATTISGREITEVIDQYVSAFEKGSSQQMLGLFAEDNQLKRPLTLKSLRTQYSGLFDHSDERWVEFRELSWNKSSRETRGKGKLRTSVRVLPSGEYKTVTTNVMIAMRKIDNVTRITDFEISDDSIFAVASLGKAHKPTGGFAAKDRPKYPTQGELQDVITQYVDSYQSGDIRGIMELFASSTWTANPSGLEELRRDYLDLFDTTTDRQVFISNIDWTFKDNKAMGTGDLVINLLSNQDHKITKKKGKVRLIVEKNLQKARISHLFQIVN